MPVAAGSLSAAERLDSDYVRELWEKASERVEHDPDGAVTAARTLIEAVCKAILDEANLEDADGEKLPSLYSKVAAELNLAPSSHSEQQFKQILGGCQTVVEGLAGIRNRYSDSHARRRRGVRPAPRDAELAVNLAGSMASFLAATWQRRKAEQQAA